MVDIGAHLGVFTIAMGRLVGPSGHVISFEPTPSLNAALRAIVQLNGLSSLVDIRNEAVADASGTQMFYEDGNIASNANSLVKSDRCDQGTTVPTVTLDEFLADRGLDAHCLKVDVEGAELSVLRGAEDTLTRCRPAISLAVHPPLLHLVGHTMEEIWDLVEKHKMSAFCRRKPVDRHWFCSQQGLFDIHLLPAA
ncbi:MAG: FkbM family methyltransferase [Planctomycetes bacterium]|nr:FkbM family methyltransferase [Planctomycetota bacterium]